MLSLEEQKDEHTSQTEAGGGEREAEKVDARKK